MKWKAILRLFLARRNLKVVIKCPMLMVLVSRNIRFRGSRLRAFRVQYGYDKCKHRVLRWCVHTPTLHGDGHCYLDTQSLTAETHLRSGTHNDGNCRVGMCCWVGSRPLQWKKYDKHSRATERARSLLMRWWRLHRATLPTSGTRCVGFCDMEKCLCLVHNLVK